MDKCIIFSINNDYSFALAVVLMSLKDNSENVFNTSDFIVYHDGVSDKNQGLLKSISERIQFINFNENDTLPEEIYNHHQMKRYGRYIYQKLRAFELVSQYKRVLWLDADMVIQGNIEELFTYEENMVYDSVCWKLSSVVEEKDLEPGMKEHSCCHGGVVCFNQSIANQIKREDIIEAFNKTKEGKTGGIEERMLGYIIYRKQFSFKSLSKAECNTDPSHQNIDQSKIIHFIYGPLKKPWSNSAVYAAFPEWAYYYKKWIQMGGEGPIKELKGFYSKAYTFKFLSNVSTYIEVLKELSGIIKDNPSLFMKPDITNPYFQFFIENIPTQYIMKF